MSDSLIDSLLCSLNSLSLNNSDLNESTTSEMTENNNPPANVEININILKLYADSIPPYDGSELELEPFINAVDEFYDLYFSTNIALNKCIERIISGKLRNRARMLIGARPELNSWALIKQHLRDTFGDNRSIDILEQTLFTMTMQRNESPLEFARRIQTNRSKLCFKLNSQPATEMTREQKLIYISQYESQSLKVFLRNLNMRTCDFIRSRNPHTLEAAINLYIENENFVQSQIQTQNLISKQPVKTQAGQHSSNKFQSQTPHKYNFQNQFLQFPPQQSFPSQPIPIQPRPNLNYRFPTNKQVFGNRQNQNVFRPNPNRTPQHPPEPMSIQSRQNFSTNKNFQNQPQPRLTSGQVRQQFPWVQRTQGPKYTVQELHAINDEPSDIANDIENAGYVYPEYQNDANSDNYQLTAEDELNQKTDQYYNPYNREFSEDPVDNASYDLNLENPNFLDLPQTDRQT